MPADKLIETVADGLLKSWAEQDPTKGARFWRAMAISEARDFVRMMQAYEAATSKPVEG
jgi:hypothetical protein